MLALENMRGLDLAIFDFDYDATWMGLFMTEDGKVISRYGGLGQFSLDELARLGRVLSLVKWVPDNRRSNSFRAEDYPAARRKGGNSCIHCHQIHEFRRQELQDQGKWSPESEFHFPPPENLGIVLEDTPASRVKTIFSQSPADLAGIKIGDQLVKLNGIPVFSRADVRHGLDLAPPEGKMDVAWKRGEKIFQGQMMLGAGWRRYDISWRWSLKSLAPGPGVHGVDLELGEREKLGIAPQQLAFRQGNFLSRPAQQAGLRIRDIILGVDDRKLEMNVRQFETFVRLNYKVGTVVHYQVLRGTERLSIPMKLIDP